MHRARNAECIAMLPACGRRHPDGILRRSEAVVTHAAPSDPGESFCGSLQRAAATGRRPGTPTDIARRHRREVISTTRPRRAARRRARAASRRSHRSARWGLRIRPRCATRTAGRARVEEASPEPHQREWDDFGVAQPLIDAGYAAAKAALAEVSFPAAATPVAERGAGGA